MVAPRLIAHAGGDIYGIKMTNSRQALDKSYEEGFRFFELDISTASDGIPVLVHDWDIGKLLVNKVDDPMHPTSKELKSGKTLLNLEIMDLHKLAKWVSRNKDAYVITDIKDNNIKMLQILKENHPEIISRIIPQIYKFEEYEPVKNMGFTNIILTLYRLKVTDQEIISFCERNTLFALTVSIQRATSEFLNKYSVLKIPLYVHTINEYDSYVKLRRAGVYGVYTDYFQPDKWAE
jgi:glycerophosphoryl diester phosphodiesterase